MDLFANNKLILSFQNVEILLRSLGECEMFIVSISSENIFIVNWNKGETCCLDSTSLQKLNIPSLARLVVTPEVMKYGHSLSRQFPNIYLKRQMISDLSIMRRWYYALASGQPVQDRCRNNTF